MTVSGRWIYPMIVLDVLYDESGGEARHSLFQ